MKFISFAFWYFFFLKLCQRSCSKIVINNTSVDPPVIYYFSNLMDGLFSVLNSSFSAQLNFYLEGEAYHILNDNISISNSLALFQGTLHTIDFLNQKLNLKRSFIIRKLKLFSKYFLECDNIFISNFRQYFNHFQKYKFYLNSCLSDIFEMFNNEPIFPSL